MKLRTIILFAMMAGLFSYPMLKAPKGAPSNSSFQTVPTNFDSYSNAMAKQSPKTQGFLSRIFGTVTDANVETSNVSATGNTNLNLGTIGSGNPYNTTSANQFASINQPSFSEPVYTSFYNLSEFLRFDLTPQWIQQKWDRVSVIQGPDRLTGMRVAVVSGPRPADISGSLTYFFDDDQRMQRICFKGWTGDASELVQIAQRLGLTRTRSNAASLYIRQSWGKPAGVLRFDYPPVIQRELPNQRLMILFEFVNPSSSLSVSEPTQAILASMENGR